jgi:S1-C subfamily serine protease
MKALILLPTLLAVLSISLHGQDWSLHTNALSKSVFPYYTDDGACSAVLVNASDDIVLTAAHCVPVLAEGKYGSVAIDQKHAEPLTVNTVLDLAKLKVKGLKGTAVVMRKEDADAGLPVAVVGFGFAATQLKFGFGWVSDYRDDSLRQIGDKVYFGLVGFVPGHSGGALFDQQGRLVTIVQGVVYAGPSALGYGAPSEVVSDFVGDDWPKP